MHGEWNTNGSKMKHMFKLVANCGRSMVEFLHEEAKAGKGLKFGMKDVFWRYATDVIASVAFGIQVDSMRDPDNEFAKKSDQVLGSSSDMDEAVEIIAFLMSLIPKVKLNLKFLESEASSNFKRLIMDIIEQRESQGITRKDILQILMDVRKRTLKHSSEKQLTKDQARSARTEISCIGKSLHSREWKDSELIAQCFEFCSAGFRPPSLLMAFMAYELTMNPDIQNRLYKEIRDTDESLKGEKLSYEGLQEMEYMDMVVSEVLRKWPPVEALVRFCNKDYMFDDGSGTRFVIEKGSSIVIPVGALHHDPQYFPDPEKFDPERFSKENRLKIHPGPYIPFGVGPRTCLGSRFALMEVKTVMYHLLKNFSLERTKIMGIFPPKKGIWVEFRPRPKIKRFRTKRRFPKCQNTKHRTIKRRMPDSRMDITLEVTEHRAIFFKLLSDLWDELTDELQHTRIVFISLCRTCYPLLVIIAVLLGFGSALYIFSDYCTIIVLVLCTILLNLWFSYNYIPFFRIICTAILKLLMR